MRVRPEFDPANGEHIHFSSDRLCLRFREKSIINFRSTQKFIHLNTLKRSGARTSRLRSRDFSKEKIRSRSLD